MNKENLFDAALKGLVLVVIVLVVVFFATARLSKSEAKATLSTFCDLEYVDVDYSETVSRDIYGYEAAKLTLIIYPKTRQDQDLLFECAEVLSSEYNVRIIYGDEN